MQEQPQGNPKDGMRRGVDGMASWMLMIIWHPAATRKHPEKWGGGPSGD
jgi:hypothetical protein